MKTQVRRAAWLSLAGGLALGILAGQHTARAQGPRMTTEAAASPSLMPPAASDAPVQHQAPGVSNRRGNWGGGGGGGGGSGCNSYGCWENGGGCNSYGCWGSSIGSCNSYGCSNYGTCNSYGCPKPGRPGGSCNSYGCWQGGGGCNSYGCWHRPSGSCNSYGCSERGTCNSYGCP